MKRSDRMLNFFIIGTHSGFSHQCQGMQSFTCIIAAWPVSRCFLRELTITQLWSIQMENIFNIGGDNVEVLLKSQDFAEIFNIFRILGCWGSDARGVVRNLQLSLVPLKWQFLQVLKVGGFCLLYSVLEELVN